jgi:inorganic pyrophosphatase
VNYGFIPSGSPVQKNSDPLDILVLGKPLKTAQVLAVKPIGILKMMDDGEVDDKILSIPVQSKHQIIEIADFQDLSENYVHIRNMITEWFLHYDKNANIEILGWSDEEKALEIIKKITVLE